MIHKLPVIIEDFTKEHKLLDRCIMNLLWLEQKGGNGMDILNKILGKEIQMVPVILEFNCGTKVPGYRIVEYTPDGPTMRTVSAEPLSINAKPWLTAETYRVRHDYQEEQ